MIRGGRRVPGSAIRDRRRTPDSPEVSRLATDGALLNAALESGRAAARAAFSAS